MEPILQVSHLTKRYQIVTAVDDLSFSVKAGNIVGLLGPNGCGKSTTMKIAAGLINDYTGSVTVAGIPVSEETKGLVSYLPEKTYLNDWMRCGYAVDYFADFYADFDKAKALELLRRFEINPALRQKQMSKGMQEKLQTILVMSRAARLYILDEPLSGIDPAARSMMLDIILNNYAPGASILMSTHLIYDVESIFDAVIIMSGGRLLVSDTVDNIRQTTGQSVDAYFRDVFKFVG